METGTFFALTGAEQEEDVKLAVMTGLAIV